HARGIRRVPQGRHRQMDAGHPRNRHQGGLTMTYLDIFNHFMPRSIFDRLSQLVPGHIALSAFPELPTLWDVDARLRLMDEFDGLQQVLSLANPPIEVLGPPQKTPELARIANDGLAELSRKYPERFPCVIASMPMNNVEAAVEEADRAINTLGTKGIQVCPT